MQKAPKSHIRIEAVENVHGCTISVFDNGIGLNEKQQRLIWQPFYRELSTPSYGLGLSIVAGAAQLNGWRLNVTSQLGQGSCFTITVPKTK
jgi:signal transduction histidine kinase